MNEPIPEGLLEQAPPKRRAPGRRMVDWLFSPWMKEVDTAPLDWRQDAHRAFVEQQPLRARAILYTIVAITICLVIWAALSKIDEVTRGQGKVIPSQQVQVIQSQDGGVVTQILVKEGDIVKKGQLLVSLDQTRSQSSLRENLAEYRALVVKAQRLRAVADKTPFTPDPAMEESVPGIIDQEMALYKSSQEQLSLDKKIAEDQLNQRKEELTEVKAREAQAARSLSLAQREMDLTRPMVSSGAVSEVEILRLEREVNKLSGERKQADAQISRLQSAIKEAEGKVSEVELDFINKVREELADTISRLNALREAGTGLSDRVKQTEVRSPVNGTVKQLYYHTIGGVVLPGKEIVEVVPADDTLLLEVRIKPKDIAFLVPGQKALVKFTAYDFVVYGGLEGEVEHIGADTVMDDEGNPFYEVLVRTYKSGISEDKPIIPGMTVEVDILTGKKTILAYLMKPVLRAKQYAMTER